MTLLLMPLLGVSTAAGQCAISAHVTSQSVTVGGSDPNGDPADDAPLPESEQARYASTDTGVVEITRPRPMLLSKSGWEAVATIDAQVTADDNIFISHRNRQSDLVFTFSPTVALGIGDVRDEFRRLSLATFSPAVIDESYAPRSFFFLRYTPTVTLFVDHDGEDSLDHDAAAQAHWQLAYLTLDSQTRFQTLSSPDTDLGERVKRSIASQDFNAFYDYSDRTSFEFHLNGTVRHYETAIDSEDVAMQDSVNYRVGARTAAGLGVTFGWLHTDDGGDQPYEQVLLRGRCHMTEKIDLWGNAGVEFRQFEDHGDRTEPVFQCGITYQPWTQTLLTADVLRNVTSSAATEGLDIVSTEIHLNVTQRFAGRYYLGLLGSFQSAQYFSLVEGGQPRSDEILFLRPYVKMDLSRSAAMELGYAFWNNDSSISRYRFDQNQVFLNFSAMF